MDFKVKFLLGSSMGYRTPLGLVWKTGASISKNIRLAVNPDTGNLLSFCPRGVLNLELMQRGSGGRNAGCRVTKVVLYFVLASSSVLCEPRGSGQVMHSICFEIGSFPCTSKPRLRCARRGTWQCIEWSLKSSGTRQVLLISQSWYFT